MIIFLAGEDVTANIASIASLPRQIPAWDQGFPEEVEVRGEVYMPIAEFERLNAALVRLDMIWNGVLKCYSCRVCLYAIGLFAFLQRV